MNQNLSTWSFTPCQSTWLFASNFCPSTLQPANWTLKIHVTVLHVDGTDHESQGNWTWTPFTKLVSRWCFYSSKLTGVSSYGVTPGPSTGHTLMGLHCIHWILQQNLRIQSQAPEQKLCHKASWFYGMVTSRPFTYREPSSTARSSGASLNRIVEIYVPESSSWYLEPNET